MVHSPPEFVLGKYEPAANGSCCGPGGYQPCCRTAKAGLPQGCCRVSEDESCHISADAGHILPHHGQAQASRGPWSLWQGLPHTVPKHMTDSNGDPRARLEQNFGPACLKIFIQDLPGIQCIVLDPK